MKRVFLFVLDSVGIGEMPDAKDYGDEGSNTLLAVSKSSRFFAPNLQKLGLFNIERVTLTPKMKSPMGCFARMTELSKGKDTTIGHWEIAGIESKQALPTYPGGFPQQIIAQFEELTGRKVVCNQAYSGTAVLEHYGRHHQETGDLIVYTSADSVFQIAAHEDIISPEELYKYCHIARSILIGKHSVGRVIARPFTGEYPNYERTANRHDFSLIPPNTTMLDQIKDAGLEVVAIGKISDIFAGSGITQTIRTIGNEDGIECAIECIQNSDFTGLCFINLVDFDMLYGHRNDIDGYAEAIAQFDRNLPRIIKSLRKDDILIITADHGCDPSTASTDHSREYTPLLIYGQALKKGADLKTRPTFSDIAATILEFFEIPSQIKGKSFLSEVKNG